MSRKVPYFKQTVKGGLYNFEKKKFTKTYIPNSVLKNGYKIRTSGCGPCACAGALYYALGKFFEPNSLNARYYPGHGSAHDIFHYECSKRGVLTVYTTDIKKVAKALKMGCIVGNVQGPGIFTKRGHFILLIDNIDGRIAVNDSASKARSYRFSGKTYSLAQIDKNARRSGKQYTIIYPHPLKTARKGDKGEAVERWQCFLAWFYKLEESFVDGSFGSNTEKYTKKFQREVCNFKTIHGIAGPQTRAKAIEQYKKAIK